ncbi:MAG: hypothetical protein ABI887_11095 [Burkholderiales bacterium]
MVQSFIAAAGGVDKAREVPAFMGSEDFGSFGANGVPVVLWDLYASPYADRDGAPNHSPDFAIDEFSLRIAVRALTSATVAFMTKPTK